MGTINLPKHPSPPSQRKPAEEELNTTAYEGLQQAETQMLEDETAAIVKYLADKLPEDIFKRLNAKKYLKETLRRSLDRYCRETADCYTTSNGSAEAPAASRHTPDEIAKLLRGEGSAKFNAGEIEKSAENKWNINDLEVHANNILRRKTGAGAFLCADAAGSIVKCMFRDNELKPQTVTDVRLSINIPDLDLIDPAFHRHAAVKHLIKNLISRQIIENIDRIIGESKANEHELEERMTNFFSKIDSAGITAAHAGGHIGKNTDVGNIRVCGFNAAVNSLVSILDRSGLDCQIIENIKNERDFIIQEYDGSDPLSLPDERYELRLRYLDSEQLAEDCRVYDDQTRNYTHAVQQLWDLIEVVYQDSKSVFKINDFEDMLKKNKSRMRDLNKFGAGESMYGIHDNIIGEKGNIRARLARMHERIKNMYEFLYPIERRAMEERLEQLEKECSRLEFVINPHYLQPGLLVDAVITSIKRKKTTQDSIAAVLREFLPGVYDGFQAAALRQLSNNK